MDDGSTDNSLAVAREFEKKYDNIRCINKTNGGVASARNHGLKFTNPNSEYIIFYDADDIMHSKMLEVLESEISKNPKMGAVYCDYVFIDEDNRRIGKLEMPRFIPTRFWVSKEENKQSLTRFISIFCWTQMFESLTLIRRSAYNMTNGWNEEIGNIGEGVDLFSEIALNWQIGYVNQELYYYRRYQRQVTNVRNNTFEKQSEKVISKWREKEWLNEETQKLVKIAIIFYVHRLRAYKYSGSFLHQLRHSPVKFIKTFFYFLYHYFYSLRIIHSFSILLKTF